MSELQPLLDAFRALKPNSRRHAEFFLTNGRLHSEVHFVIRERLADFIRRVEAAGPAVREKLLAELEGATG
jgi:hypothetical protein